MFGEIAPNAGSMYGNISRFKAKCLMKLVRLTRETGLVRAVKVPPREVTAECILLHKDELPSTARMGWDMEEDQEPSSLPHIRSLRPHIKNKNKNTP